MTAFRVESWFMLHLHPSTPSSFFLHLLVPFLFIKLLSPHFSLCRFYFILWILVINLGTPRRMETEEGPWAAGRAQAGSPTQGDKVSCKAKHHNKWWASGHMQPDVGPRVSGALGAFYLMIWVRKTSWHPLRSLVIGYWNAQFKLIILFALGKSKWFVMNRIEIVLKLVAGLTFLLRPACIKTILSVKVM